MRNPARTRTCAGCGKKADKNELVRIGRTADGKVAIGQGGRGAYLCKSVACLNAAIKKKRIGAVLRAPVPTEIYGQLENIAGSDEN